MNFLISIIGNKNVGKRDFLSLLAGTYPTQYPRRVVNIMFETNKGNIIVEFTTFINKPDFIIIMCDQNNHSSIRAVNDKYIPQLFKNADITPALICSIKNNDPSADNIYNLEMIVKLSGLPHFAISTKLTSDFVEFQKMINYILFKILDDADDIEFECFYELK